MTELPDPACADCVAFSAESRNDQQKMVGRCRFRPEMSRITEDFPYCDHFQVRRDRIGQVRIPPPPKKRRGGGSSPRRSSDDAPYAPQYATLEDPVTGDTSGEIAMDRNGLKQVLRELLQEETLYGYPAIGQRWEGGKLIIKPEDDSLQAKEVPLDTFFHKIVMLRDRLRVLEAKINGNNSLKEAEKIELQGYISKAYGTLTTFNVLFADKNDHFSSK
jgi:hypothetical protein